MQSPRKPLSVGHRSGVAADRHLRQDDCDAPGGLENRFFGPFERSAKRLESLNTEKGIDMPLSLTPVLTHSEIEHIHERSLDLLERVGIDYQTPRALEVLERHGCPVDYERNWASLPRAFVEWAIEQAPRVVRLEARDPSRSLVLDGRRAHHSCDSQGTRAIDFETG